MDVVCWCCEMFNVYERFTISEDGRFINGYCRLKAIEVHSEDTVCEDYVFRLGLHTTRTIPKYCKNYYNKKKQKDE